MASLTSLLIKNYGSLISNAFESIKQGLEEAVVHEFSPAFGISVSTLRHWERRGRTPHGPVLVLLNVVAKEPQAALKVLSA